VVPAEKVLLLTLVDRETAEAARAQRQRAEAGATP
jgi:hypothetical protein